MTLDVELVRNAKAGNKESFARMYEYIASDLYKVALYTLGNTHDAEDVVSETFIEAYKGIKNLRNEESFKPWIMRILSIRCKRRIKGYMESKGNIDLEELIGNTAEEENIQDAYIERNLVFSALMKLKQQERLIVVLSVIEGYSAGEIASMLKMPRGTVSSKLHRSLEKMKKALM